MAILSATQTHTSHELLYATSHNQALASETSHRNIPKMTQLGQSSVSLYSGCERQHLALWPHTTLCGEIRQACEKQPTRQTAPRAKTSGRTASSYTGGVLSTARQPVSHSNRSRFFIAAPRPSTNSWLGHMARDCRCPRLHLGRASACRSCWEREVIPPQPVELTSSEQTAQTHLKTGRSPVLPLGPTVPTSHRPRVPTQSTLSLPSSGCNQMFSALGKSRERMHIQPSMALLQNIVQMQSEESANPKSGCMITRPNTDARPQGQ